MSYLEKERRGTPQQRRAMEAFGSYLCNKMSDDLYRRVWCAFQLVVNGHAVGVC